MENFRTKAIAEMTKNERDYLRNELNEVDKKDINEQLELIKEQSEKQKARIDIIEKEHEKTQTEVESLKKNTNVICSPFHSKRKRNFNKLCKSRVWSLFNNDIDSCE